MTLTERAIHLDLSMPQPQTRSDDQTDPKPSGGQPDAQAQQRFREALMAAPGRAGAAQADRADASESRHRVVDPMALLAARMPGSHAPGVAGVGGRTVEGAPDTATLCAWLDDAVATLLVGQGRSGGQQVRMELDDDLLPGVTVSIEEVEGRLQVDFVCSVERSRLLLHERLPELAQQLAQRLAREVLVRLQTDDEEDPCLLEIHVGAQPAQV